MTCRLCDDSCVGVDLDPLLSPQLTWLWTRLAEVADRRGDPLLTAGSVTVTAPAAAHERAAATGLLGGLPLRAGQSRRVDLMDLTGRLSRRGIALTPGAVAAHATVRRLAAKSVQRAQHEATLQQLRAQLEERLLDLPAHVTVYVDPTTAWARLQQLGAVARLTKQPNPARLIEQAGIVVRNLPMPGTSADRRTLVPGRPHDLDEGSPLAALVLALTGRTGLRTRIAWASLGVVIDNLTGGLLSLGVHPASWGLPAGAVVTVPPRELAKVTWAPAPHSGCWAFVTENPSVLAAAADHVENDGGPIRLLCTVGTPSAVETAAIGRLADAGWRVAVRADFDPSGLSHVRALLAAAPTAVVWRMGEEDYRSSHPGAPTGLSVTADQAPWAPGLAEAMTAVGAPAFEEALLPELLADLVAGQPRTP